MGIAETVTNIELAVRWPAVLGEVPFLELHIFGRLVRSDLNGIAIETSRYNFQKLERPWVAFDQVFTDAVIQ
jgi:hypothetical protein